MNIEEATMQRIRDIVERIKARSRSHGVLLHNMVSVELRQAVNSDLKPHGFNDMHMNSVTQVKKSHHFIINPGKKEEARRQELQMIEKVDDIKFRTRL